MVGELYQLFLEQTRILLCFEYYRKMSFPNSIRKMMRRIVKMNELREIMLPSLNPHILRHTACIRMAEAEMDIATLQYLMGHNNIKTTLQTYNHVDVKLHNK